MLYPKGIPARRIAVRTKEAGIPPGYKRLMGTDPGGVAALDHRLWAVTPSVHRGGLDESGFWLTAGG